MSAHYLQSLSGAVVGGLAFAVAGAAGGADADASGRANYARPFEPPTRPAFIPLPPGAVEPGGWLRDWCLAARDGYTGHMDEVDDEFKRAWAADHQMTGEGLLWYKGAWPYEGGGYWFDGLARLGYALHDEALIEQAKQRLYAVADHMTPHGLLFLWWLDRDKPEDRKAATAALDGWPLWACGLLGRAMSGYYAGSGDRHVLAALEKAYSGDRDCLRSIPGNISNLWPAFDAYTWTGNKAIGAALDALFKEEGGGLLPNVNRYRQAPDLTPGSTVDNAHVVEFLECTTPWAVGYLWTGEARYLRAAVGWHDLLERIAMQPHGVPVSDEWYGPTGAFRGSETCDVAGYVWSQAALLAVAGEGRMGDRLERAFFNAGPATVSRDFRTHVYFQSPNRIAAGSPDFPHGPRASGGSYQSKHGPLCCTAALNRVVPWYVTHMWMATYDNGLAATCYGPCKVTALVADRVPIEIECRTEYPFGETIDILVSPAREAAFPLSLRIPGWCANPGLTVDGSAVQVGPDAKGFVCLRRAWRPGDRVRLQLPMAAVVATGRDAAQGAPHDGAHRAVSVTVPASDSAQGAPYATVSYGPLLFALAIPDTGGPNTPDPSACWRYALDVQDPGIAVERQALPPRWDWPLNAPLTLRANAAPIDWEPDPQAPALPGEAVAKRGPVERIALIPYGCTKFRVSMFPVMAAAEAVDIGSRLEMMVDEALVERRSESVDLRLHQPVRRDLAITFDRPWEGNACGYCTVIQDGDLCRLYYRGSCMRIGDGRIEYTHPEVTCYAESRDGIVWTRPDLGLVEYDGSTSNNIILKSNALGEGAGSGISHNFSPMLDANPDCKPAERFKALGGSGRGLLALASADGVRWSLLSEKPVVTKGAFDSQNLAFWDPLRRCYVEYHRAGRQGRDVMMATSKDFLTWSEPEWLDYTPARLTELYTSQVKPYYRAQHLYLGFPARYVAGRGWYSALNESISRLSGCQRCGTDYTDTGFLCSRDGKTFTVWPEAFVRPGPAPALWMYGFGYTAWGLVETASSVPGGPPEISFYITDAGGWTGAGNSLCRYTLRLDGFVSARAPLAGGEVVTKPLVFAGEGLRINFETSVAGSLQIELQDARGQAIPGFALADCPALFGNSTDYRVEWTSQTPLASLAGSPIRLRFVLRDADLYAFRFL